MGGRIEHAFVAASIFLLLIVLRWLWLRASPGRRAHVASTPIAKARKVLFTLALSPVALFAIAQLMPNPEASSDTKPRPAATIEEQMAALRAAPGRHVVGGQLYRDGVLDPVGTEQMLTAIDAVNQRQTLVEDQLDSQVRLRKEALSAGFDAQRDAVYRRFEASPDGAKK